MQEQSKIVSVSLIILAFVSLAVIFIYTKIILVPFIIAVFFYSALIPLFDFIKTKLKLSKIFVMILSILLFLCLAFGLAILIYNSANDFLKSTDQYRIKVNDFVRDASVFSSKFGMDLDAAKIKDYLTDMPLFSLAKNVSGTVFSIISNFLLIIVFMLFMITGTRSRTGENRLINEIQGKISKYINVKLLTSSITAVAIGIIFLIFGVDLAFMFAVLVFLLNFIPNIGSIIATVIPVPVILLQFGPGWELFLILGLTGAIQFSVGNLIEPRLMGKAMGLHPVTVLMFLMFWGLVWGIPGLFLAVPITAAVKIILNNIETTKPLARMLEGNFGPVK